jgi:small subunit ribosomal protein S6
VTRDYELGFILTPEVNEEQTRAIQERIEQIVTTHGGQVTRVNQWGRRRLAYPIEHHRDGFYVFVDMILTPESVSELDRSLKVSEEVLRHLIKRRDPKLVQKEREEREEREARAAAQAAAAAEAGEQEQPAEESAQPTEESAQPAEEAVVEAVTEETAVSAPEEDYVPPAIPEETVEEA